ncbi:TolC family protein [Pseudohalioglobus lutimaris]|uniref:TolC family protein n=1 Tax=Pseudohalioglobus lutimaris TaxID=1737061 RepID=UPI001FAF9D08|nr:TolC family protein [Pseudohalioglobus lutimaris]
MNTSPLKNFWPQLLAALMLTLPSVAANAALSLSQAITIAQQQDPWIEGNQLRQQALEAQSIAAGSLPDPVITAGFANLPTDSFNFDQEAMTQFKVGISQVLPRGDSLALSQQRLGLLSQQHPLQRADRHALIESEVSGLWLDVWRTRETIQLIEQDRDLFEQLVDIAESKYTSALGGTRQQDLIRAQLELTRLEDRLLELHEQMDAYRSALGQWLEQPGEVNSNSLHQSLTDELPGITLKSPELVYDESTAVTLQTLAELMGAHPAILSLDRKLEASSTDIKLAEQKYRPLWQLNASYGYREDDPMGNDRADFFSVGVTFDVPLFTGRRQDQQLRSAQASSESVRTEKSLLLRRMVAQFNGLKARLLRIEQRQNLYNSRLLEQMSEQAEASLAAYTNDDADFTEVIRARIAELNARIEALGISVERQKITAQLNYFFTPAMTGEDA